MCKQLSLATSHFNFGTEDVNISIKLSLSMLSVSSLDRLLHGIQTKKEMEEDSEGLLPIKETYMKYYVYVSTPIALVG